MNTVKIDMATIAKAFGEFNGTEEDVVAWLNNCQAVAKLTALPEDYQFFALVAALKGRARLWFTSASAAVTTWELDTFKIRLKARFSASEHNRKILEKFQAIRIANNRTEFKELIDLSTEIYSRGLVNMTGLYEQFISRIPSTVRATISIQAATVESWEEVTALATKMVWIAFPKLDPVLPANTIAASKIWLQERKGKPKFCQAHGNGNHESKDCLVLKRLEKMGGRSKNTPG